MKTSTLEHGFLTYWKMLAKGYPEPAREYRFAPPRKFRFDFAFLDERVAIECEGGIYSFGRHVRGKGYIGDCDKYNLATSLGWRVFRFTRDHFKNPSMPIKMVMEALRQ